MIRPILEYGCIVFDNCSSSDCTSIESVQYEAARVYTGALWNTNKLKLLEELGWSLMSKRREYFKLCMFFRIKHGLAPTYLAGNHLSSVADLTRYSLKNSSSIRPIRTRTNKYKSSYFPSTIHSWNNLPFDILQMEQLEPFKTKLSTFIFPKPAPSYYNYGERWSAIYHTRVHLGHSSLN